MSVPSPESRVPSDACRLDSDPITLRTPTSRLWRSLRSARLLRPRFVLVVLLLALVLGLTAAQLEALLTHSTAPVPEVGAQNSSAGCNWTCCRPLTLFVHATGHSIVDPDPNNEPNQVDLVWRHGFQRSKINAAVPIRFRLKYCEGWGSQNCHIYVGYTEISNLGSPTIMESDDGEPWPTVGTCGQVLPPPFPSATQIVSLAPWQSPNPANLGETICGTNAELDEVACDSFVDSDYHLWIARTVDLQIPSVPTLCFNSIEIWVDGLQADDDDLLVQHNDDKGDPTCFDEAPDAYTLVSTPHWTIGRSQFISQPNAPLLPKECVEAQPSENYPGGQAYEVCIFANFTPIQ